MAQTKEQLQVTIDPSSLAAISTATINAMNQTLRPENANATPKRWNGFGGPGFPKLRWQKVFFCGAPLRPKELTKQETELLNKITTPGTYGPDKTWTVTIRESDLDLRVKGINNIEVRVGFPPFVYFLQQIVDEQSLVAA